MTGNFIENEPLLRRFNKKQLRKFAKENKIPLWDIRSNPFPSFKQPVLQKLDYEELIERIAPRVAKDKIIESAKRQSIEISDLL